MEFFSVDDLRAATEEPQPIERILLPAPINKWGWVQGLSALERTRYEFLFTKGAGDSRRTDYTKMLNARALLAVRCLVKGPEDRTRLLTDADAAWLGKLSGALMEPLYDLCRKLSGMSKADMAELEQLSTEEDPSAPASS